LTFLHRVAMMVLPNDERIKMKKYNVIVSAEINTSFEANTAEEAIAMADEWVGEEYGNLKHKANYKAVEIK
jgi:hypothetical protein